MPATATRFRVPLTTRGLACLLATMALLVPAADLAVAEAVNLALGKTVRFAPESNYALTSRGHTDALDLTDGQPSTRKDDKLWFDSKAVAFSYAGLVQMAVDLGRDADVGEVTVRLQGGSPQAGVALPCWVDLVASSDGVRYYRVASYSRWNSDARQAFGIPPDEGAAWVHPLRFRNVNVRARHVGLAMYGAGLSVTDELQVLTGPDDATYAAPATGKATAFSVTGPRVYFHKPVVFVPSNIDAPTPLGLILPPGGSPKAVTLEIDLPAGIRFTGGSVGGKPVAEAKAEPVDDGRFTRYTFALTTKAGNKTWGRVYLRSSLPDGQAGVVRHRLAWDGGASVRIAQPIRTLHVTQAPTPKRLMTGLGWWGLGDTMAWPDALGAFRLLGFNTLPLFARWTNLDDADTMATIERFRRAGFKVLNIDSTFHHMLATARKRRTEVVCQLPDGKHGDRLCPSYRGELYASEIARVARECTRAKADILSCDIELWNWRGPLDAPNCARCQADFKSTGATDWKTWQLDKGYAMWVDLATAVRTSATNAGLRPPELGVYDFRPGTAYQNTWPFDRLYPNTMDNSQVSTYTPLYPYHLELIGDEARADRQQLPKSDVLPWITPGDAGTFPGEVFTWALLECFANGSRGVHFWSGRLWDTETLDAYARAIRMVVPVENVIVDGNLVRGARCDPAMRVSGMQHGKEVFLLVANYRTPRKGNVQITLPVAGPARVTDLATARRVAHMEQDTNTFTVRFDGERAKALHVEPVRTP